LNRYGISTEFSGKVKINLNVVMQSKEILEIERSKIREKQGIETFNLYSHIENSENSVKYSSRETEDEINLMKTSVHGVINRFSK
jgi:hypothetical protein